MALYFYFNETTGDLVYSDKSTYGGSGYTSLGEQTNMEPSSKEDWVFGSRSQRLAIVTVSKDESIVGKIAGLKSMKNMFNNCNNITSLDLSGFDTSSVTYMGSMFSDCSGLTSLDLSGLDTSSVTDMDSMFNNCNNITSLDLSGFDTSSVTGMQRMFSNCSGLTSLDLSGFDTSVLGNKLNIFRNCSSLRLVTISDKMSNVLSQLPADQYYPAAGGSPVAKASLTAGTWVRDEADLTKVTSIVQQAQMQQAISRRIGNLRRDLEARIREASALLDQLDFAAGGLIPVENGGTGATSASAALTALGAASASDIDALRDSLSHKVGFYNATDASLSSNVSSGQHVILSVTSELGNYSLVTDGSGIMLWDGSREVHRVRWDT